MAVQSPTDRLLTEATAAAAYRTAAQVDTQADARIALKRGAANGLASLGADGVVPAAQLPAVSSPSQTVYVPAQVTLAQSTTAVADVGLNLSLVAGTYLIDGWWTLGSTATPYYRIWRDTTSLTASYFALTGISNAAATGTQYPNAAVVNNFGVNVVTMRGRITLSAAKTLNVDMCANGANTLNAGAITALRVA